MGKGNKYDTNLPPAKAYHDGLSFRTNVKTSFREKSYESDLANKNNAFRCFQQVLDKK